MRRKGYDGFPGYQFHGNAEQIFTRVFGDKNPFKDFFAAHQQSPVALFGSKFGGLHGMNPKTTVAATKTTPADASNTNNTSIGEGTSANATEIVTGNPALQGPQKGLPVEHELQVSLEEMYSGTVRKVKITRKVLEDNGATTSVAEHLLKIDICRGWMEGTRITFSGLGDEGPTTIPADVVFILRQKPHATFTRQGHDLIYTETIPLAKALTGFVVTLQTLDGRVLRIPVNEVV
ncbi:DnaJ sub B member 13, partial [Quaeritorhiza haematococci]